MTGLDRARHERIVIADDDVRYDERSLQSVVDALDAADVIRPQNYFDPVPWHACLDTARTLLNRISGGDWPGTLALRRGALGADGYDGDVMFENLELVRTAIANGATATCLPGLYVRRFPPSTRHFWSQRVRQAYDEFARPLRLGLWLAILPCAAASIALGYWGALVSAGALTVAMAETGRRRARGAQVFPALASWVAPVWILERAVCAWLAVGAYAFYGGIPYRGRIIRRAATPLRILRARAVSSSARGIVRPSSVASLPRCGPTRP